MINKYAVYSLLFFIFSCNNIEFVIKEGEQLDELKDKTVLIITGDNTNRFSRELNSFLGNKKSYEYILKTNFIEKKENRIVKKNQVAEKIEYTLEINYDLSYKTTECRILNKKIITSFAFTPKSAGYNFGTDRSFDKLYNASIRENIENFIELVPINKVCL